MYKSILMNFEVFHFQYKVGCVFSMVIRSGFRMGQYLFDPEDSEIRIEKFSNNFRNQKSHF